MYLSVSPLFNRSKSKLPPFIISCFRPVQTALLGATQNDNIVTTVEVPSKTNHQTQHICHHLSHKEIVLASTIQTSTSLELYMHNCTYTLHRSHALQHWKNIKLCRMRADNIISELSHPVSTFSCPLSQRQVLDS